MKRVITLLAVLALLSSAALAMASTKDGEKAFLADLKKAIPQDKIMTMDDLHTKWLAVQAGKSDAVIIDIRTEAEFDAGHIKDSNNIDSGHAYGLPKKIEDPEREIWVFCRTQHRASYFVAMLYKYGYKNVYLAQGGIKGWAEKGYPLVNKYLGEIKVATYHKKLKEDYLYRENK